MTAPPLWDAYDGYLFDIDGTLLHCTDAVHFFAFCDTLSHIAGRPLNLDGVVTHGNVDIGILRDALATAGIPEPEWRPRLPEMIDLTCRHVERNAHHFDIAVLPGVVEVLDRLRAGGATLGVATGNLERIGRAKLAHCGLLPYFHFGGYSDRFEYRRDVFAAALAQARTLAGPEARVCVLGDTPEDIRAAHANSLDVIAVATGIYPLDALAAERPTRAIGTLTDLLA